MEISVVITCFNHEAFISSCIQSVIKQSIFSSCELIIFDDCSTDNTINEIYKTTSELKNVQVFKNDNNVGMLKNFAKAINTASCEFIAYLDGDDYFISRDKLEQDLQFLLNQADRNFVFSPALIEKDGNLTDVIRNKYRRWKQEVSIEWLAKRGGGFYPTSSVFFRKRILTDLPFDYWMFNDQYDLPLAIAAILFGKKIHYRNEIATVYRVHNKSVSNKQKSKYFEAKRLLIRRKKNIAFAKMLRRNRLIDQLSHNYLVRWEKFNCAWRLLDVGYLNSNVRRAFYGLDGWFRIMIFLKFAIRSPIIISLIFCFLLLLSIIYLKI